MRHLIIEIKARCTDPERIKQILYARSARYVGRDHQVDTYFRVSRGRLKLREGNIENALIYYDRVNELGPKKSDVLLYKTEPGTSLKALLVDALGILAVVDKYREIYFVENVKIHIDEVLGLGSFVEVEAIDSEGKIEPEALRKQCEDFLELFSIAPQDLVSSSYSDMLLNNI